MIITNSRIAFDYLRPKFNSAQEEVYVLCLDSQLRLVHCELVFKGTLDFCVFHARDVFRIAIRHNAHSILLAHNHPSGQCLPSQQDRKITRNLIKIGEVMEIRLVDHIIFCTEEFYSFSERKRTSVPRLRKTDLHCHQNQNLPQPLEASLK